MQAALSVRLAKIGLALSLSGAALGTAGLAGWLLGAPLPVPLLLALLTAVTATLGASLVALASRPLVARREAGDTDSDLRLAGTLDRELPLALDHASLDEQLRLQAAVANHLSEGITLIRVCDGVIMYANPRFEEMFGCGSGELTGKHISTINAPGLGSPEEIAEELGAYLRAKGTWHGEIENVKKDGTRIWCYGSVSTFDHPRFGPVWLSVHTDITERKRIEKERAQALEDNEILLREIHHRVKNNLQVISSLFYLQGQRTEDAQLRRLLDESRSRVQSIALVHDQLYQSESLVGIKFDDYLRRLTAGIEATYSSRKIRVEVSAAGVLLDIEHAVPCGLLIGELLSNALKHAFPGDRGGTVRVSAREEGGRDIIIEVADDGVGIPDGAEKRGSRTLGLQLVQSLTSQLRGRSELDRSRGTRFTVRFPLHPDAD